MTVGAIVVPETPEEALADAAGRVAVRRIVEAAWAGGALPILVLVADADGRVAAAVEGSPASHRRSRCCAGRGGLAGRASRPRARPSWG